MNPTPEKNASREKLDEIKSLINDNPIWEDTFKGRKKKIQLSRRVNAAVDTAIKVRKQLEKITPEAMEAKQEGFKQEANKAHPEDSSKAEEVSTQRYKQWLEEQGSECKALTKKLTRSGIKPKRVG
ncbi:hypothetical protein GCM10007938_40210 [Vibrio zhanjiangensis]|uniref:Uncharacterized protein n=1 Tax=Vibrio zhanjiangensis TaxID=1046128 RepID=A0ABQ6F3Z1_9VIBR|nr:hypothetical protein [Vibrio zhanjiangensis]GLT20238.1 hypothetical protein GCM10007938_40210 [Vibrio zhanjiangensis]